MTEQEESLATCDLDAEAAVLSAALLNPEAFDVVAEFLEPRHFYSEKHRRIYEACVWLREAEQPIDVVQAATRLRDTNRLSQVGGMAGITDILNAAPGVTPTSAAAYATTVFDLSKARDVIYRSRELIALGETRSLTPTALAQRAADQMTELSELRGLETGALHIGAAVERVFKDLSRSWEHGIAKGIRTGFHEWDAITAGGFHEGELTIVGARSGMGKTSLILSVALNVVQRPATLFDERGKLEVPQAVCIFSLEMPVDQLVLRLLANLAGVSLSKLRAGIDITPDDWTELTKAATTLVSLPLYVDDEAGLHHRDIVSRTRQLKRRLAAQRGPETPNGVALRVVIVDYLQLVNGSGPNIRSKEEEISKVSYALKHRLAKGEKVAVLAPAQLNREVESRGNKRPMLSDIRNSGAIEQDADNVMFIYRPEAYGEKVEEHEHGKTELIYGKQRSGAAAADGAVAIVRYRGIYTRFESM